jgi:signal peptidase II
VARAQAGDSQNGLVLFNCLHLNLRNLRTIGVDMSRWHHLGFALVVVAADQLAKVAVVAGFNDEASLQIIPNFFRLVHVENRGIAFGMFSDSSGFGPILALISAAAIILIGFLLWQNQSAGKLGGIALALMLGGAAGNLIDRLVRGQVVDFLDFYVGGYHWPAFNIADSAICVGAALLFLDLVTHRHPKLDANSASSENR